MRFLLSIHLFPLLALVLPVQATPLRHGGMAKRSAPGAFLPDFRSITASPGVAGTTNPYDELSLSEANLKRDGGGTRTKNLEKDLMDAEAKKNRAYRRMVTVSQNYDNVVNAALQNPSDEDVSEQREAWALRLKNAIERYQHAHQKEETLRGLVKVYEREKMAEAKGKGKKK